MLLQKKLRILAVETSCDNTALSVLNTIDGVLNVEKSFNLEQDDLLISFGGVFPTESSKEHLNSLQKIIKELSLKDISLVACTREPGLQGSLAIGISFAQTIAFIANVPFVFVNHLDGHILSPRMFHKLSFPYLSILASGGHCRIDLVKGICEGKLMLENKSETHDDSPGEVFDKIARELGIKPPKGAILAKLADQGQEDERFKCVVPKTTTQQMSFSGIKSHFVRRIHKYAENFRIEDVCFELQLIIARTLCCKVKKVLLTLDNSKALEGVTFVGGVAANKFINYKLKSLLVSLGLKVFEIPPYYATDNSEMIGWAALEGCLAQRPRAPGF